MYAQPALWEVILSYAMAISQLFMQIAAPIFLMMIWLNLRKLNKAAPEALPAVAAVETSAAPAAVKVKAGRPKKAGAAKVEE